MKLSLLFTVYDRPLGVLDAVWSSLKEQPFDEAVIVLDRTAKPVADHIYKLWGADDRVRFARIAGASGWSSPVPAWNKAFSEATGDFLYAFSSEVVHAPQNIALVRDMLRDNPRQAIFGRCSCSCGPQGKEVNWNDGSPGNLLIDAAHPRPLGFIWAGPLADVKEMGGMDPEFAKGLWYDDDDFFLRLWQRGLDFTFTDEISGTHLHHDRPVLSTPEGQAAIERNAAYVISKYGCLQPQQLMRPLALSSPGLTRWRHL